MSGQIKQALAAAKPGTRIKGQIPVGTFASGIPIGIAFVAVKGRREGPCLWVNGQVHGVEINGVLAALDFINSVDVDDLAGSIVVTATANPLAFDAREKGAPQDGYDLDQTFPGRASGFITERMAAILFKEVSSTASLLINMHTNSPAFEGKPYGVYKYRPGQSTSERELLQYIACFQPSVACLMDIKPGQGELLGDISGALDYQLLGQGTPAFMIELGGGSRAEAHYIEQGVKGMQGVARILGVLPAVPGPLGPAIIRRVTRRRHVLFDHGGLFRTTRQPGEFVRAGEPLGEVMNIHGELADRMTLKNDAIIICIRRDPVVHTGDRFIFVAEAWEDVDCNS